MFFVFIIQKIIRNYQNLEENINITQQMGYSRQLCKPGDKVISARKANILTSQPCLHTLMQTRLSANQSARIILVVLHLQISFPMSLFDI